MSRPLPVLVILALMAPLGAFMGRMLPAPEVRRVEATDRPDRHLSFLPLSNESPGQLPFLAADLPKTLALALAEPRWIQVGRTDRDPVVTGLDAYEVLAFPRTAGGLLTQTGSNSEGPVLLSNLPSHPRFSHAYTQASGAVVFLHRPAWRTVDAMRPDFNTNQLAPGQAVFRPASRPDLPPRVILQDATNDQRLLRVSPEMWMGDPRSVPEWFARTKADYLVTGSYKDLGDNQIRLKLILFVRHTGEGRIFYDGILPTERVLEESASLPNLLLGTLQGRAMVEPITFVTTPPGAHVHVSGSYLGTTPFVAPALPVGPQVFTWWHPDARPSSNSRPTGAGVPVAVHSNGFTLDLKPSDRHGTNFLVLNPATGTGRLQIQLKTNAAHLWLDGQLIASGIGTTNLRLPPGEHLLSTQPIGSPFAPRKFRITIEPDHLCRLQLDPRLQPDSVRPLPARDLTTLFGALSVVSLSGTLYATYRRDDFIDRGNVARSKYLDAANSEFAQAAEWNKAVTAGLWITGTSLLGTLIFRILDIHQREIRIETSLSHGPDVRLQYQREF